jgi:hypothetical protein
VANAANPTGFSSLKACVSDSAAPLFLFGKVKVSSGNGEAEAPRDVCVISFFLGVFSVKGGQLDCLWMYPDFVEY